MFLIEHSCILILLFVSVQSYLKEFSFSNANQDDLWTHIQMVLILSLGFLLSSNSGEFAPRIWSIFLLQI